MKHAIHNMSSAGIWLDCDRYYHEKTAAIEAGIDFDTTSAASIRGTLLHDISERALPLFMNSNDLLMSDAIEQGRQAYEAETGDEIDLDDEDLEQVEIALEAVVDLFAALQIQGYKPEVALQLSHEPNSQGYVDVLAWSDETLLVIDYKYGVGEVEPDAPQLKGYGANAIDRLWPKLEVKPKKVLLAIVQPKLYREARVFETTPMELKKFQAYVEIKVADQKGGADRGASNLSTCKWCPFKENCSAYAGLVMNSYDDARKGGLTDHELEELYKAKSEIENVLKGAAKTIIENPDRFPSWTRYDVRNPAKWSPNFSQEDIAFNIRCAGVDDPYVLNTPAKLKDAFPDAADEIDQYCTERGSHVRLKPGAPTDGTPATAPEKRPPAEDGGAPKRVKVVRKKAAKKKATKKKAVKKAAAKKAPAKRGRKQN